MNSRGVPGVTAHKMQLIVSDAAISDGPAQRDLPVSYAAMAAGTLATLEQRIPLDQHREINASDSICSMSVNMNWSAHG